MVYDHWQTNEDDILQLQIFQPLKRALGHDHPTTLDSLSDLAMKYFEKDRLKRST
jgi:hypothetical protein